jgi:gamma-glutamyl:cysteine ligase YbdK (ATP-grasp superfamily)
MSTAFMCGSSRDGCEHVSQRAVEFGASTTVSQNTKRSIEVEYWVIDSEGHLVEPGSLVDASPGAEREFVEPLLEVKTTPCETTAELRGELFERIEAVLDRAADLDRGLVPLATPVHEDEIAELPAARTRVQNRAVGGQFAHVRHCAGTHIHVEQEPGGAIDQLNVLTALDPALALVNSSPYFQGEQIAASARSKLYRWRAYESLPPQGRLWPYTEDRAEWQRRLDQRYEEFLAAALDAGVDRETVETHFDPESAVWTPVKLRAEFGTVEWRAPDTALPSQVVRLADDVVGVLDHIGDAEVRIGGKPEVTDDALVLPAFDTLREYVDAAIEEGLTDEIREYLDRMGFAVWQYDPLSPAVGGRAAVDADTARQLRIEAARRLERDIGRRSSVRAD